VENFVCMLLCIIMSIFSVKFTKIQYLQSSVCAEKSEKLIYFYESTQKLATRAAPFGPDMHQIVCRLGLRPSPHWGGGAHSALPDPLAGVGGGPPGKEGGREKGKGRDRKGEEGKGKRE